jgi:hypothetical protein
MDDCLLLQSDINSVQNCCTADCMKRNAGKTNLISFSVKINIPTFNCDWDFA